MTVPRFQPLGLENYTSLTPDIETLSVLLGAGTFRLHATSLLGQDETSRLTSRLAHPLKAHQSVYANWPKEVFQGVAASLRNCEYVRADGTKTNAVCSIPLLSAKALHTKRVAYNFGRRLKQISRLDASERPSEDTLDIAKFFESYTTELAEARNVEKPITVVSVIDSSALLVEWNMRGKVIRHLECEVRRGSSNQFGLLSSIEKVNGRIERMTEIPEASMAEVLSHIESLLAHAPYSASKP